MSQPSVTSLMMPATDIDSHQTCTLMLQSDQSERRYTLAVACNASWIEPYDVGLKNQRVRSTIDSHGMAPAWRSSRAKRITVRLYSSSVFSIAPAETRR